MMSPMRRVVVLVLSFALAGCASTPPYTGIGPHPQISRGHSVPPIDVLGNILSLPWKLLFWSWKLDRHSISPETENYLRAYIDDPRSKATDTHFSLNEYAPGRDLQRLVSNRKVAWPYRLLLGLPETLIRDLLLPGRLFGGDHYNPFTDTVSIFSDHPAIALHEAGHVHDFNSQKHKGTYAVFRYFLFFTLHQEMEATSEAIEYFQNQGDRDQELRAYKILYPAFGSYAGSILPLIGNVIAIMVGHATGRAKAISRAKYYESLDHQQAGARGTSQPLLAPPEISAPATEEVQP